MGENPKLDFVIPDHMPDLIIYYRENEKSQKVPMTARSVWRLGETKYLEYCVPVGYCHRITCKL